MKILALLAAIMMTTMMTFAQCSEAKAHSEGTENIHVSIITDTDQTVIIEANISKVEKLIAGLNVKANVIRSFENNFSAKNATASNSGFKFMNDYYSDAPVETEDYSFTKTKESINKTSTDNFTFMGDTYQEMPEEQLNLDLIPNTNKKNTEGSFYFLGDQYQELPEERNDLPQEEEKEGVFYFMGDKYSDLPAEADQPIL